MLLSVSDLFKRALAPYHKFPKLVTGFIFLMLLPVLFFGIAKFSVDLIGLVYGVITTNTMLLIAGSTLVSILSLWFSIGYILAIADIESGAMPQKISAYLKKSRAFILPALGLTLLVSAIVVGGVVLLFIPGIIFSIWFVFTLQARVLDQKKGLSALTMSKSLVNGNWWGVFGRTALSIMLISILMSACGSILGRLFQVNPADLTFQKLTVVTFSLTVLTALVQALFTPFASAIPTILYLDLKRSKTAPVDTLEPPAV